MAELCALGYQSCLLLVARAAGGANEAGAAAAELRTMGKEGSGGAERVRRVRRVMDLLKAQRAEAGALVSAAFQVSESFKQWEGVWEFSVGNTGRGGRRGGAQGDGAAQSATGGGGSVGQCRIPGESASRSRGGVRMGVFTGGIREGWGGAKGGGG